MKPQDCTGTMGSADRSGPGGDTPSGRSSRNLQSHSEQDSGGTDRRAVNGRSHEGDVHKLPCFRLPGRSTHWRGDDLRRRVDARSTSPPPGRYVPTIVADPGFRSIRRYSSGTSESNHRSDPAFANFVGVPCVQTVGGSSNS